MARIVRYEASGRILDYIPDGSAAEWSGKPNVLVDADETSVAVLPVSQWRVVGGLLRPATAAEISADAAADNLVFRKAIRQRAVDAFTGSNSLLEKAIALFFLDQVNALRAAVAPPLTPITALQMRNGILAKMNSGDADS